MIGITCLLIPVGTAGRLLAEVGRINRLAEDEGRSKLPIISDDSWVAWDAPSAFAATWSAALTAAAVLWDLSCATVVIPGLMDLFLEVGFSRYVSVSDLFLEYRLLIDVNPPAEL